MNHATTGAGHIKTGIKRIITRTALIAAAVVVMFFVWKLTHHSTFTTADNGAADTEQSSNSNGDNSTQNGFDSKARSTTAAASLWVIVNKQHPLNPKTYAPTLVVPDVHLKGSASASNMHVSSQMSGALVSLFNAASRAGFSLMLSSGYRSYDYQVKVYGGIVGSKGQTQADRESARPGYSEHQTGLAADVAPRSGRCDLAQCFGTTPEGKWLAANAYRYGFIIRYPADKVSVTGYEYEPWHIRYVGVDLATQMHSHGIETLEEFFHISGGTSYN